MTRPGIHDLLYASTGFVPRVVAPMGKWEPNMRAEQCLREVAARAAAALAVSEALHADDGGSLWFLSAEGHLKRQPRPGCLMAAEILMELGADPQRIRCWPAANRTINEVTSLSHMRDSLPGGGGLLLVTSGYHVLRTRLILWRELRHARPIHVMSFSDPMVARALDTLPPRRRARLIQVIERGSRRGMQRLPVAVSEGLAFAAGLVPGLEATVADRLRGSVKQDPAEIFTPWPAPPPAPGSDPRRPQRPRRHAPGRR